MTHSAAVAHQARCARPVSIVRVRAQQPRVGPEAGRLRRPALAVEHTAQDVEQRQREGCDEQREAPVRGAVNPAGKRVRSMPSVTSCRSGNPPHDTNGSQQAAREAGLRLRIAHKALADQKG